jgi:hypothetical protein
MLRIPHCLDNRLTVNCEILATFSSTYSPVSYLTGSTLRLHKIKLSPLRDCGSLQGCEMSKRLHFLDNLLTDGGLVVSFTLRPRFMVVIFTGNGVSIII